MMFAGEPRVLEQLVESNKGLEFAFDCLWLAGTDLRPILPVLAKVNHNTNRACTVSGEIAAQGSLISFHSDQSVRVYAFEYGTSHSYCD